jgi:hypothetical protein
VKTDPDELEAYRSKKAFFNVRLREQREKEDNGITASTSNMPRISRVSHEIKKLDSMPDEERKRSRRAQTRYMKLGSESMTAQLDEDYETSLKLTEELLPFAKRNPLC